LLEWFLRFAASHKDVLENPYLRRWQTAALRARHESP
jgi:hypothetical protein